MLKNLEEAAKRFETVVRSAESRPHCGNEGVDATGDREGEGRRRVVLVI